MVAAVITAMQSPAPPSRPTPPAYAAEQAPTSQYCYLHSGHSSFVQDCCANQRQVRRQTHPLWLGGAEPGWGEGLGRCGGDSLLVTAAF